MRVHDAPIRAFTIGRFPHAADVDLAAEVLERAANDADAATVVKLEWEEIPLLLDELAMSVDALAEATLAMWPALYVSAAERLAPEMWSERRTDELAHSAPRLVPGVSAAGARYLIAACQRGERPSLEPLALSDRVRQLALALDPEQLVLMLVAHDESPALQRLLAFARGVEWLAQSSGARVAAVLHERLRHSQELDHIAYAATTLSAVSPTPLPRRTEVSAGTRTAVPCGVPQVTVSAIVGRPHPSSEAEKRLYEHLTHDDELGPLFSYNQVIKTAFGTKPRVDLAWPDGRLVVEVDGADHRKAHRFCDDRVRDYELMVTGFRVLRLVDTEVLMDPKLALAKIRNAVGFLKRAENE